MILDELLQLTDELPVTTESEICLDASLERGEAELLEAGDRGLRERLVREIGEGRASPQRKSLAKHARRLLGLALVERPHALVEKALEAIEIDLSRLDTQHVSRTTGEDDPIRRARFLERPPEVGNVVLDDLRCGGRRRLSPELVDEAVAGYHSTSMQEEEREEGLLLSAPDQHRPIPIADLEGPENAEFQAPLRAARLPLAARSPRPTGHSGRLWASVDQPMGDLLPPPPILTSRRPHGAVATRKES
jgi:hypothetical protein